MKAAGEAFVPARGPGKVRRPGGLIPAGTREGTLAPGRYVGPGKVRWPREGTLVRRVVGRYAG